MSSNGTSDGAAHINDRKRKPSDPLPSSPVPKQIKIEDAASSITGTSNGGNGAASMSQQSGPAAAAAAAAVVNVPEEQKRKYMQGIENLRNVVMTKGAASIEGQEAQRRIDHLVALLKNQAQRQQQQSYQAQAAAMAQAGAAGGARVMRPAPANVPASIPATQAPPARPPTSQNWIPPNNIAPEDAGRWRAEIAQKLGTIGQKLNAAKARMAECQAALEGGTLSDQQQQDYRKEFESSKNHYDHWKEVLSKFAQQQKILASQRANQAQQNTQQNNTQQNQPPPPPPGAAPPQNVMAARPAQPQAMGGLARQQQPSVAQVPQPHPAMMARQASQPTPSAAGTPQQMGGRATPVQRADSPQGVAGHVTTLNQQRQNGASMSPTAQPALPNRSAMPTPQQQAQQPPPPQQLPQQPQQPGQPPRGSAPGTPVANSPAVRQGSVQPGQMRPPTASNTPAPQQRPSPVTTVHPSNKMPIPTTLSVPKPEPVPMPSARPTLTGGANTPGNHVLGGPAVVKPPSFEFDEQGMGLLSKRKLEELVRQIDPDEKLDPDVEEVCVCLSPFAPLPFTRFSILLFVLCCVCLLFFFFFALVAELTLPFSMHSRYWNWSTSLLTLSSCRPAAWPNYAAQRRLT